jgi:hypothetical protein
VNYRTNLFRFERGSDGSIYVTLSIGNPVGMHLSLHRSGITQIATRNPKDSERFDRRLLLSDISKKKSLLSSRSSHFQHDTGEFLLAIIKTDNILKHVAEMTRRRLDVDVRSLMNSIMLVDTNDIGYAWRYLYSKNKLVTNRDMMVIQDMKDNSLRFFTSQLAADLTNTKSVRLDISEPASLYQLPGMEPIFPVVKKLDERMNLGRLLNKADNVFGSCSLEPGSILDLRK